MSLASLNVTRLWVFTGAETEGGLFVYLRFQMSDGGSFDSIDSGGLIWTNCLLPHLIDCEAADVMKVLCSPLPFIASPLLQHGHESSITFEIFPLTSRCTKSHKSLLKKDCFKKRTKLKNNQIPKKAHEVNIHYVLKV